MMIGIQIWKSIPRNVKCRARKSMGAIPRGTGALGVKISF
jgi:hypothetical protein